MVKNRLKMPFSGRFGPKNRVFGHFQPQMDTDRHGWGCFSVDWRAEPGNRKGKQPRVPPQANRQPPRSTTHPKSVSIGVHPWSAFVPFVCFVVKSPEPVLFRFSPRSTTPPKSVSIGVHPWLVFAPFVCFVVESPEPVRFRFSAWFALEGGAQYPPVFAPASRAGRWFSQLAPLPFSRNYRQTG